MGRMKTFEEFLFLHKNKNHQDNKHVEKYHQAHISEIKLKYFIQSCLIGEKD